MSIQKFIVSKDDSIYEAFPDLVQTDSGKLICVFTECTEHADRTDARLVITESLDRGRTWSPKKPLTEKGTKTDNFNCARISKMRDGTLKIICDRLKVEDGKYSSQIYVWSADPEGENWSDPVVYPFNGIVPDKFLELKNGRWIIAAHTPEQSEEHPLLEQYLWYSDDRGKTWSDRVTVAADSRYNLCEVSLLEYDDNTLVAFLREDSFEGYDMLKVISHDNGETWSEIYNLPMDAGIRPVAGFLNDGTTVMVTYRFRPLRAQNMFASFLRKEDLMCVWRQQHRARIMPLDYDRNPEPDLGYTGWTQFADGEIYVVNYIKDDSDKAHIRGYSFYIDDVMISKKKTAKVDLWPDQEKGYWEDDQIHP